MIDLKIRNHNKRIKNTTSDFHNGKFLSVNFNEYGKTNLITVEHTV
jgi:hypothetical protein